MRSISAIEVGNAVEAAGFVAYFGLTDPNIRLRLVEHYAFLTGGLPETSRGSRNAQHGMIRPGRIARRRIARALFVRCAAAMVIGDENPHHASRSWRRNGGVRTLGARSGLVDTDVVVPILLVRRAEYAACSSPPASLPHACRIARALTGSEGGPDLAHARPGFLHDGAGTRTDASLAQLRIQGVPPLRLGGRTSRRALAAGSSGIFVTKGWPSYAEDPQPASSSPAPTASSPHLHFGHIGPLTIALAVVRQRRPRRTHRRLPRRADRPSRAGDQLRGPEPRLRPPRRLPRDGR